MSAAPVTAPQLPAQEAPPRRGSLRLVPPRRSRAPRAPFLLVVTALAGFSLLGLLGLHTALAEDAFRLHELQRESRVLADREQDLVLAVESMSAPAALAARARGLGMVPGGPPAFLRLSDGKVLGDPVAASAAPSASPSPAQTAGARR